MKRPTALRVATRGALIMPVVAAVLATLALPTALAAGAGTIATAPTVAYGTQEFGNTATDNPTAGQKVNGITLSWWQLPVVAGDHVTIRMQDQSGSTDLTAEAWPVGTTDYTLGNQNPAYGSAVTQNGDSQFSFVASASGNMPLLFLPTAYGDTSTNPDSFYTNLGSPGPYNFTATVVHALASHVVSSESARDVLRFSDTLHGGDGSTLPATSQVTLKLEYKSASKWVVLHQYGARGSQITGTFKWPKSLRKTHQVVRLLATVPGYTASSASTTITVR